MWQHIVYLGYSAAGPIDGWPPLALTIVHMLRRHHFVNIVVLTTKCVVVPVVEKTVPSPVARNLVRRFTRVYIVLRFRVQNA